jgi:hypothetical protein
MQDSDFSDERTVALQRLAALQRLREQALATGHMGMVESIDNLIGQERKALARDLDDEPA